MAQNIGNISKELEVFFKNSSPEQYEVLREAGYLEQHLESASKWIARAKEEIRSRQDLALLRAEARDRVLRVDQSIFEKIRLGKKFSDDRQNWAKELHVHLKELGPESYEKSLEAGWVDDHVSIVVKKATMTMKSRLEKGDDPSLALAKAKEVLLYQSTPILEPPKQLIARSLSAKVLSYQQFRELREWYLQLTITEDKEDFLIAVLSLLNERPEVGILLESATFANIFASDEFYNLCLGASYFGQGKISNAELCFSQVMEQSELPLVFLLRANCLRAKGKLRESLRLLGAGSEKFPDNRDLVLTAAGVAFALGDSQLANNLFSPIRQNYFATPSHQRMIELRRQELAEAIANNQYYRQEPSPMDSEPVARETWWNSWNHYNTYTKYQHAEAVLAGVLPELLQKTFNLLDKPPQTFVELGTTCGEIIFRVAEQNSSTQYVGLNKQECFKKLNDEAYKLPNLQFVAEDIFSFLTKQQEKFNQGMLFHVGTAPTFYPAFLKKLYADCAAAGFRYVVLFESYCLSYEQQKFVAFNEMEKVAEIRSGGFIHHNYPKVLAEAGFKIIHQEMPTSLGLLAKLNNVVFIVAERQD